MLAAGNLAALMKEWPLNSVTLSTVTHSKLRKALDGTGTQVATCIINRWTVKMNGVEGYITIEVSQRRARPKYRSSEDSWKLWLWSTKKPRRRRIHPRTQPEDKPLPLLHAFDHPVPLWSCQTVKEALTKAQFLSQLFYQIHCIGPVRFGFAHIYSEEPP